MKLEEYLRKIMSEENAQILEEAIEIRRPIIISGAERTGKTTLRRILRSRGLEAWEDFDPLVIHLTKTIPLEDCIPNLYRDIE